MRILSGFVDSIEVYSIDEAFLQVKAYQSLYLTDQTLAQTIRQTVAQWIGIPVSIGVAPTKTLAKVANWYAKCRPELGGVCQLIDPDDIQKALVDFDIRGLWGWGIARRPS